MQTFLPYADFRRSASVLDERRLGKQRSEALQVLRALETPGYGWRHHPAARMWRGYADALASYGAAICAEWVARGHPDTCLAQILAEVGCQVAAPQEQLEREGKLPSWLGDAEFHRSHQAALVRKNPQFYSRLFPDVDPARPYVWPAGKPAV